MVKNLTIMEITDELIQELSLTPKQMAAAKAVYKAIKAAGKLGVNFWDNYGTLTAYNSKKIEVPIMEGMLSYSERNDDRHFEASNGYGKLVLYYQDLPNYYCGNADDTFYAEIL